MNLIPDQTLLELRGYFSNGATVTLTFVKTNGERRRIRCTTNLRQVPKDKWPKPKVPEPQAESPVTPPPPAPGERLYRAFDLDKGEWRSFKESTIQSIQVVDHEVPRYD